MKYLKTILFIFINLFYINNACANISFSEIFPNTTDDKNLEYVVFLNEWNTEQSLSWFILSDKSAKEYIFLESDIIQAWEKKKYLRTLTKIILNNSDEELFLTDNLWNIIDAFSYSETTKWEAIIVWEVSNNAGNQTEEVVVVEKIIEEEEKEVVEIEEVEEETVKEENTEIIEDSTINTGTWNIENNEENQEVQEKIIDFSNANIKFIHIFANTEDDKNLEYIEIINNWNNEQNLHWLILSDKSAKEYIFLESDIIQAWEKKKYPRTLTKIILNNSDEELFLKDSLWNIIDNFSYSETTKWEIITVWEKQNNNEQNQEEGEIVNTWSIEEENNEEIQEKLTQTNTVEVDVEEIVEEEKIIIIPEVVLNFQSPTYLLNLDINQPEYSCDNTKEICKINLDFRDSFIWEFKEGDYKCETDFWFENDQENKCNPSSVVIPVGIFDLKIKILHKEYSDKFSEKTIRVVNKWYIEPEKKKKEVVNEKKEEDKKELEIEEKNIKSNLKKGMVQIYGAMPNPKGSDNNEYIELKNNTKNIINLLNCSLDDKLNGWTKAYVFKQNEYLWVWEIKKYKKEQIKINLNNDADEINLICNDEIVDNLSRHFKIKEWYYVNHQKLDINSWKAVVIDVIDWDTLKIKFNNSDKIETLRLVWVDTPETKHPDKEKEKYWEEVYKYVVEELKWKEVFIEIDTEKLRDTYSRLLWFVYLWQINFNKKLIELWYSEAYLDYDFKYKDEYILAENKAKELWIWIWANSVSEKNWLNEKEINNTREVIAKISVQWKIGKNKILKDNKLICYETCSVNFDWRGSGWNIKKYSWDFWNWEKFEWVNPWYIKYENYWNYKVYLATVDDSWKLDIEEFYVTYIKTPKKQKTSIIPKANAEEFISEEIENEYIEFNSAGDEESNNYSILLYIIISIFWVLIVVVILKKEKLI